MYKDIQSSGMRAIFKNVRKYIHTLNKQLSFHCAVHSCLWNFTREKLPFLFNVL